MSNLVYAKYSNEAFPKSMLDPNILIGPIQEVAGRDVILLTASRDLTVDDSGRNFVSISSSAIVLTYAKNLGPNFALPSIVQGGAGIISITAGPGTIVWNSSGTQGQGTEISARVLGVDILNVETVFGNIPGTITNDDAAPGCRGEYLSLIIPTPGVALTTTIAANLGFILVPPGDWDVSGQIDFKAGGATTFTTLKAGTSLISATIGGQDSAFNLALAGTLAAAQDITQLLPTTRYSFAVATLLYVVAQCTFAVSTLSGYGTLRLRRMR